MDKNNKTCKPDQADKWTEELSVLASVLDAFPFEKTTKWGSDVYTYKGRNVVSYGGFKHFCSLWFYNGVFLKDPYKVLINAQEGKTKALRQWRFTSLQEIDIEKIKEYLHEVIDIEERGLSVAKSDKAATPPHPLLENQLKTDPDFREAYAKLSAGKQKEYQVFIQEPKREDTRQNRLNKIIPMIMRGEGLNDKYK